MTGNHVKPTDTTQFLSDLYAGVFNQQIGHALSDVAEGVTNTGKKGKLVLTFDFEKNGDSTQAKVKHRLHYIVPTAKGKRSEEYTTETPMHVGNGGRMTLMPERQNDLFKVNNEN